MLKKALFLFFILLSIIYTMSATDVDILLNNGDVVIGEIVGKVGENIFVLTIEENFTIPRNQINQIKSGRRTITDMSFNRRDWLSPKATVQSFTPYFEDQAFDKNDLSSFNIEEMTEREFELYLAQIQADATRESAESTNRTRWHVFWMQYVVALVLAILYLIFV